MDNFRMQGLTINHVKLSCDLQNAIAEYQDTSVAFEEGKAEPEEIQTTIDNLRNSLKLWSETSDALIAYCSAVLFNR